MIASLSTVIASGESPKDYLYNLVPRIFAAFISLRQWSGDVKDQLQVGSCVANAICNALELIYLHATGITVRLSRQFIYDLGRILDGLEGQSGMMPRTGLVVAWRYGVPLESEYPYRNTEETIDPRTLPAVMASAATFKLIRFERIDMSANDPAGQSLAIRSALSEGCPLVTVRRVGQKIFEIAGPLDRQVYPQLNSPGNAYIGDHATCTEEHQDAVGGPVDENSWGPEFGDRGFFRTTVPAMLFDIYEEWVIRGVRVGGVDHYIEPQFISDQQIRDFVAMLIAKYPTDIATAARILWRAKLEHGVTSSRLERAMGWPAGSVDQYANDHGWI